MTAPLTLLVTDLANSTALWEQAPAAMRVAQARHDQLMRQSVEMHHGRVVKTTGDGLHAVFDSLLDSLAAALAGQRCVAAEDWPAEIGPFKVLMRAHTGESRAREGGMPPWRKTAFST